MSPSTRATNLCESRHGQNTHIDGNSRRWNPLQVTVGNVVLNSPLMLASGTLGEYPDKLIEALHMGAGAVVTRTIRQHVDAQRSQTPAPRYFVMTDGSMLNCEWGNSRSWTFWREHGIDEVSRHGPLILSISGRHIDDAVNLIRIFDSHDVIAYEINISCPHSNKMFGRVGEDTKHLACLLTQAKQVTSKAIWIKLGWTHNTIIMGKVAEDSGADAVVTTNSMGPGLVIDTEHATPVLGIQSGEGGISGNAIRPLAIAAVYELSQALKIPIIGCGGISTADHVVQFVMAGASAVQLYTSAYLHFRFCAHY